MPLLFVAAPLPLPAPLPLDLATPLPLDPATPLPLDPATPLPLPTPPAASSSSLYSLGALRGSRYMLFSISNDQVHLSITWLSASIVQMMFWISCSKVIPSKHVTTGVACRCGTNAVLCVPVVRNPFTIQSPHNSAHDCSGRSSSQTCIRINLSACQHSAHMCFWLKREPSKQWLSFLSPLLCPLQDA